VCARSRKGIDVTIRVETISATSVALLAIAVVIVKWKPSARSRSLREISALSARPARIGPAQATKVDASPSHGSFLPVRQVARRATQASPFQSARGYILCGRPPNVPPRDSLCNGILPGGLKGRGPLAGRRPVVA